ncbi:cation:proton antiporter [Agromyces aerolatus]|uniref:cation:proton antiporter n=1 Tax=Agromyces sp. LY-1074 TaxID=3074080 RepID=UPI00285A76FF|nr:MULTISPECIES: cation:proton antiporter [unclassified Agromyces]MDR5699896.1 cation:proton antiporter [Agromyces sp. LY-1074]MDR5706292.1 cation:proton antiporter [Agromyces sp. LY-1358]
MPFDLSLTTLVLFPAIAVIAPIIARFVGRLLPVPLVVFEILLGLLFGPAILGWIQPGEVASALADFGLAMLFFLAGNEIDFRAIRGRPLMRAGVGWVISLAAGIGLAALLAPHLSAAVFIGIALASTALGTIMPVLRDSGDLRTAFGVGILAVGAVGEFGPLLAISVFLSGRSPAAAASVLLLFVVVAGVAIWLAARGAGKRMHRVITATLHTSGQFAVRLVVFILLALAALSTLLGLDMLLGAFTAGVLYRLLLSGAPERDVESVEGKLEGVGYGLLVPIFFISTGVTFDLEALVADPSTLLLIPIFIVALILVRGIPSYFAAPPGSPPRDRIATGLFGATGLPIIVAVTAIGVEHGDLTTGTAAALVAAGMCSVLIFPAVGLAIRGRQTRRPGPADPAHVPTEA